MRRSTLSYLCAGLALACLCVNACNSEPANHPAFAQQRALAAQLTNPEVCHSGGSQDVQDIVDSAGPGEVIQLPPGCYQITSTIHIPPRTRWQVGS